jgi:hypothetical protein
MERGGPSHAEAPHSRSIRDELRNAVVVGIRTHGPRAVGAVLDGVASCIVFALTVLVAFVARQLAVMPTFAVGGLVAIAAISAGATYSVLHMLRLNRESHRPDSNRGPLHYE